MHCVLHSTQGITRYQCSCIMTRYCALCEHRVCPSARCTLNMSLCVHCCLILHCQQQWRLASMSGQVWLRATLQMHKKPERPRTGNILVVITKSFTKVPNEDETHEIPPILSFVTRTYPPRTYIGLFLGPRGPLVLPSVGSSRPVPSRPCALKIWITYIQAYMPYES